MAWTRPPPARPYGYGLKLRVLPALGHLPVTQITAGIIDRTIDEWEQRHGASTIKNTIAPLVRVLDEAVRDGLIQINPAKKRAKRSLNRNAFRGQSAEHASPRAHAIPDMKTLSRLARTCGRGIRSEGRLPHHCDRPRRHELGRRRGEARAA